jgi:iron(III) transport system ATP-binding protein
VVLAPVDQPFDGETVGFVAEVVDSQFGGRHYDVVVTAGGHRLEVRVPSGRLGGWARKLAMGQPVSAGFAPSTAIYFDGDGSRIAGHVPVEMPAAIGA